MGTTSPGVVRETLGAILSDPSVGLRLDARHIALIYQVRALIREGGQNEFSMDGLITYYRTLRDFMPQADAAAAEDTHILCRREISELVDQRIFLRSGRRDAYVLSSLGMQVAEEFGFVEDSEMDRLGVVYGQFSTLLGGLITAAEDASEDWDEITRKIRFGLTEAVSGMERRQATLERMAMRTRDTVRAVLSQRWQEGVEQCETILARNVRTSSDLMDCYTVHNERAIRQLERLGRLARRARQPAAGAAVREVESSLARVGGWIAMRHADWGRFSYDVLAYIRDCVSRDEGRVLARALTAQIRAWSEMLPEEAWHIGKPHRTNPRRLADILDVPSERSIDFAQVDTAELEALSAATGIPPEDEAAVRARVAHLLETKGAAELFEVMEPFVAEGRSLSELSSLTGLAVTAMAEAGVTGATGEAPPEPLAPGILVQPFVAVRRDIAAAALAAEPEETMAAAPEEPVRPARGAIRPVPDIPATAVRSSSGQKSGQPAQKPVQKSKPPVPAARGTRRKNAHA